MIINRKKTDSPTICIIFLDLIINYIFSIFCSFYFFQHLSRFGAVAGTNHSAFFEHIHQSRRSRVSQFQFSLQIRGGCFAGFNHASARFFIHFIIVSHLSSFSSELSKMLLSAEIDPAVRVISARSFIFISVR